MRCPTCGHIEDKVVDSRSVKDGDAIRRRRECLGCGHRFTTYEYVERNALLVVKKDGRREIYNRDKVLSGLVRACEKRPVTAEKLEGIADAVETLAMGQFKREISSRDIGRLLMERLQGLDEVSYVRFASVYRRFKDVSEFQKELEELAKKEKAAARTEGGETGEEL